MKKYVFSTGFTCFSMQVFIVKKHVDFLIRIVKTEEICIDSTIKCCANRDQCVSWGGGGGVTIYIYIYI